MKKVRVEEWIPSDNIVLEDNANFAVKCKKNILVVAGPGAGKTDSEKRPFSAGACHLSLQ